MLDCLEIETFSCECILLHRLWCMRGRTLVLVNQDIASLLSPWGAPPKRRSQLWNLCVSKGLNLDPFWVSYAMSNPEFHVSSVVIPPLHVAVELPCQRYHALWRPDDCQSQNKWEVSNIWHCPISQSYAYCWLLVWLSSWTFVIDVHNCQWYIAFLRACMHSAYSHLSWRRTAHISESQTKQECFKFANTLQGFNLFWTPVGRKRGVRVWADTSWTARQHSLFASRRNAAHQTWYTHS